MLLTLYRMNTTRNRLLKHNFVGKMQFMGRGYKPPKQVLNDRREINVYCKLLQEHCIVLYGVLVLKRAMDLS